MKSFRITKLEIKNIGPFGHITLEFPEKPFGMEGKAEIHILTGENGTGKTTVLEALVRGIKVEGGNNFPHKYRRNANSFLPISLTVSFNFGQPFRISNTPIREDGAFFSESQNAYLQQIEGLGWEAARPLAFFAYSGYRRLEHVEIDGIREVTGNPLSQSLDFRYSVNPELILNWLANTLTKEALAKNNADSKSAARFKSAVESIERTISNIIEKPIRFLLNYAPLGVNVEVDSVNLNFNVLPDGLKSIISWIADLLMRLDRQKWEDDIPVFDRNFILFLDEIEVHLHPAWQRKILPAVQELFPNAQIFISTHSPFVVGSVDGAWIHKLVKPNGDSQLAKGYPMISEDAKSVRYWLNEVFGIKEQFGAEVEEDMKHFYELRDLILQGKNGENPNKLLETGRALAVQSAEVNQIIQMEIKQLNRQKGLSLSL